MIILLRKKLSIPNPYQWPGKKLWWLSPFTETDRHNKQLLHCRLGMHASLKDLGYLRSRCSFCNQEFAHSVYDGTFRTGPNPARDMKFKPGGSESHIVPCDKLDSHVTGVIIPPVIPTTETEPQIGPL